MNLKDLLDRPSLGCETFKTTRTCEWLDKIREKK